MSGLVGCGWPSPARRVWPVVPRGVGRVPDHAPRITSTCSDAEKPRPLSPARRPPPAVRAGWPGVSRVHLKSLTLRGFKSFASSTTLRFEPGITCVVGPNGAGKSNVVDALAWVMGEQGAKSLRGGKMDDVIFAGTAGRPPLGRAEVLLTIDNSDGALPIEYAEVTISRLMFRSGQSEYAVNGTPCRLLDIQELLSDSGIGRELHVIVGQGQLDAALAAEIADETAVRTRRAEVEAALLAARELESAREVEAAAAAARVSDAQDTWYRLAALAERLSGTASLARERARHLATPPPAGYQMAS